MATRQSILSPHSSVRLLPALRSLLDEHVSALALKSEPYTPVGPILILVVVLIHLTGLGAFWRYYHQPIWLAIPTLGVLLLFPLFFLRQRGYLAVGTLAPLFFLYAILVARVIAVRVLLANEPYQDEASFADPRFIPFQVEATAAAVIVYVAIAQATRLARDTERVRVIAALAAVLGLMAIGWFGIETVVHRTQGVTATDPYAYAQMAIDLAIRGSPTHTFALFPYVANAGISWYPIEHIGYRLFDNLTGRVPTVWPFGGSIWLAIAFSLWGEQGLYLATPLAGIAALVALWMLAWEFLIDRPLAIRASTAGVAVLLLATSWEQVDRSIVPLVDVQAQVLSTLTVLFALREMRQKGKWWLNGLAGGIVLGAAYLVRHTQVLMAPIFIIAVWKHPRREKLRYLFAAALAGFVVALPDLWYHREYLGSWFTPESHEMALFGLRNALPGLVTLGNRLFAGNEFGYLVPFLLYGIASAARQNRSRFGIAAVWVVVLTGFHILYEAVKLRDLLPEYPAVILMTAIGMVALVADVRRWAGDGLLRRALVGIVIYIVLLMPAMRDRITIQRPLQPAKVTFGYVTAEQRQSFDRIAALTPANAVVGSTMNDGAIDLYARRDTFRPGAWNAAERRRFVEIMFEHNRPVYLLEDGAEANAARNELESEFTLKQIAVLDVPLFGEVKGTPGALYKISRAK